MNCLLDDLPIACLSSLGVSSQCMLIGFKEEYMNKEYIHIKWMYLP